MEIRPLREEEKIKFAHILRDAFATPPTFVEFWSQNVILEETRALFDDNGAILAGLRILRNDLWLGQSKVPMAGITNVATPPEHRRGGQLKRLLREVMAEERQKGINISGLYPFEFPFYRKFGYELASALQEVTIKIGALASFKSHTPGRWVQKGPDDWQEFQALYNRYCEGKFGRIERKTERWWYRAVLTNRGEKPFTSYVWYDATGKERAYIVYDLKQLDKEWSREMRLKEMVWLDEAARYEIFCFMANHDSQAERVAFSAEPGDEFFARLSDPRQAEIKLDSGYMLRLLDVERALKERAWPLEVGRFSLSVQDDVLDWNNNRTYHIERSASGLEVTTVAGDERAGLACDVRTLAQLYAGYLSPWQAVQLGLLQVRQAADLAVAQRLFSPPGQPASFMMDFW